MIQNLYPLPVKKSKPAVKKFRAVIFTSVNPRNTPPDDAA